MLLLLFVFEKGFFCVIAALELTLYVAQAGLELTEIHLPLPPEYWIKGVCPHHSVPKSFISGKKRQKTTTTTSRSLLTKKAHSDNCTVPPLQSPLLK